jgi:MoaA/NifB/PqqE/SkfB family radical SAM enzyme
MTGAVSKIFGFLRERDRSALFGGRTLELGLALDYLRTARVGGDPPPPRLVQIEPTRACNLDCSMCERRKGERGGAMSFDFFTSIIDRDFAYPHSLLLYGQGEPLLAADIFRMIRYERSRGTFVTSVTNGTLIDAGVADEIARSGLSLLRISIDGASEASYRAVRGGADFDRVVGGAALLSDRIRSTRSGMKLVLTFMALKENYRDMPALVELASRLGVDCVEIKDLPPYADGAVRPLSVEIAEDEDLGADLGETVRRLVRTARLKKVRLITTKFHSIRGVTGCMNPWFKTFVAWDGTVALCSRLFAPPSLAMGDLTRSTFDEIWNGPRYRAARSAMAAGGVPFEECRMVP